MKNFKWLDEVTLLFSDSTRPIQSLLNFVSLMLVLWNINPESIYYDWKLWAILVVLWTGLAIILTGRKFIDLIFKQHLWLIAVWPAYTVLLWLMGKGLSHRKFIAVAFMILVSLYYLKTGLRKELAGLAKIGAAYLGIIALTTLLQFITDPSIARDLAVGRGSGNFMASALLGNFHTVYEAVLLALTLGGLLVRSKNLKLKWGWTLLLVLNLLLVGFAQYDIALISLGLGFVLLLGLSLWEHRSNRLIEKTKQPTMVEIGATGLIYSLPALAILIARGPLYKFIDQMDFNKVAISEKLFNRIWVYLRSLYLYMEFPAFGFGVQPDPGTFMVGQHSDYLDILAEYGFVGFLVFLIPWIALLLAVRNELNIKARGIYWISVIIFHIMFVLNPVLEVSAITILFFILPGLCISFEEPQARMKLS